MSPIIPHSRPWILAEDHEAVQAALLDRAVCYWHRANALARELCAYSGAKQCQLFSSGTLALRAALLSADLPSGCGVGVPAFTCVDVPAAVLAAGYRPVIVDTDERGLLSLEGVKEAGRKGLIQAVIAVHQFGLIARAMEAMAPIMPVIEDCSHVPPRSYLRGSVAVIGSLEGTKLLGAGEGGYLLLDQQPGTDPSEQGGIPVLGRRLSDVVAVLALGQLHRIEQNVERRLLIAQTYLDALGSRTPPEAERAAWFRFILRLETQQEADDLIAHAARTGITAKRPIMPYPLHRYPGIGGGECPVATQLWATWVSFPLYPDLSERGMDTVREFLARNVGKGGPNALS